MAKHKSTEPMGVFALQHLHDTGRLWLNPTYQREEVWTLSQKQLLIDSLLKGIDVPKLYFREIDDATYEYEVVDGQQRLRAIFGFLADEFALPDDQDDVDDEEIRGKTFSQLSSDLSIALRSVTLDVVTLSISYNDDDIEEIFLRLQNGTPLNAAEKRRAIRGSMRDVVASLARHDVFHLAGFSPKRYGYEDAVAKVLHLLLAGGITDIRPTSIKRTYLSHQDLAESQREPVRLRQAFNFINGAFDGKQNPAFKKYAMISVPYLVVELLDTYDLQQHRADFAEVYLDFDSARVANADLPEDEQDPRLAAYTNAARSDSIPDMQYRHDTLLACMAEGIPGLVLKDPNRGFTREQRGAIYRRSKGICQAEGCGIECDETEFHADHIVPHSRGGPTTVQNGQVLCPEHNLRKGNSL